METERFVPKRSDGQAYWRVALDTLLKHPPGTMIAHKDFLAILELTADERPLLYAAVNKAAAVLRQEHQRDVAVVRGKGYRILLANEHVGKAESHKARAEYQLKVANDVVDATDLSSLTSSEREVWHQVKRGMVLLYLAVSSHEMQLARHEALIASLQQRVSGLEEQDGDES
jgi:hypothetical protein